MRPQRTKGGEKAQRLYARRTGLTSHSEYKIATTNHASSSSRAKDTRTPESFFHLNDRASTIVLHMLVKLSGSTKVLLAYSTVRGAGTIAVHHWLWNCRGK